MGPRMMPGSIPTNEALASTVAEPVERVSHQMRAKCTNMLPSQEKAYPIQMVKKGVFQSDVVLTCVPCAELIRCPFCLWDYV